jgi:hypothetical protein
VTAEVKRLNADTKAMIGKLEKLRKKRGFSRIIEGKAAFPAKSEAAFPVGSRPG